MCSKWALSTKELPFYMRQLRPLLHQLSYVHECGGLRHPGLQEMTKSSTTTCSAWQRGGIKPSHTSFQGEVDRGRGKSLERQIEIFVSPTGNYYPSCLTSKKNCSCILEAHLFTNLIFSAFHLQRPKSNIYVHFHLVNKQLMRILELELSVKHVSNLKVKNIMEVIALYHS